MLGVCALTGGFGWSNQRWVTMLRLDCDIQGFQVCQRVVCIFCPRLFASDFYTELRLIQIGLELNRGWIFAFSHEQVFCWAEWIWLAEGEVMFLGGMRPCFVKMAIVKGFPRFASSIQVRLRMFKLTRVYQGRGRSRDCDRIEYQLDHQQVFCWGKWIWLVE
jgi:hypothetical protein